MMADGNEEWARKNLDYAVTYSVEALKAALLLNGGAAIALLTLVGALSVKEGVKIDLDVTQIKTALAAFGIGVGCATGGFSFAYSAQIFFFHHCLSGKVWQVTFANVCRFLGVASLIGAGIFFFQGISCAMDGIYQRPAAPLAPVRFTAIMPD